MREEFTPYANALATMGFLFTRESASSYLQGNGHALD